MLTGASRLVRYNHSKPKILSHRRSATKTIWKASSLHPHGLSILTVELHVKYDGGVPWQQLAQIIRQTQGRQAYHQSPQVGNQNSGEARQTACVGNQSVTNISPAIGNT